MKASSRISRRYAFRSERPCSRSSRWVAALVLQLLVASAAAASPPPDLKTGVFNPPRPAPEFALQGSDGSPLKLSRFRGKVVAVGFGYTSCPDVCPTSLYALAQAKEKLGVAGNDFQVIF